MNETLRVEQAYFKALGVETEYYDDKENECDYLVSTKLRDKMWSLVYSDQQIIALMLAHEINVTFHEGHVLSAIAPSDSCFWQPYGDAQWQTKAWALGMAVVRAATEKLLRGQA